MRTLQKLSVSFALAGIAGLLISGNIESSPRIIAVLFWASLSTLLLGVLLLLMSLPVKEKASTIMPLPSNPNSKRRIEEYFVIFNTSKKDKRQKAESNEKKPSTPKQPSISSEDWNSAYQQAVADLSPEELAKIGITK